MSQQEIQQPKTPLEITDDLITIKVVIAELVAALNAGRKSRARSLVITKLEEAAMWANEGLRTE